MNKQKVLVLDIETSLMKAEVWDTGDQFISVDQIVEDWHLMAFCAKWLGDPPAKAIYADQSKARNIKNDRPLLKQLRKLLDTADIVITQNGEKFDAPKITARLIMHGMRPPSPYRHLDTCRIAKRVARFTSNKLEYLTDKLNVKYKKLTHKKYPGRTLWRECDKGNQDAWREMRRYNIHDVLSTEELYTNLRAWAPDTMPDVYFGANPVSECRVCGETGKMAAGGTRVTKQARYRRYQCQGCGSWSIGEKLKEAA